MTLEELQRYKPTHPDYLKNAIDQFHPRSKKTVQK